MPEAQNYRNHTRLDPAFHFFLSPVLLANVGFTLFVLIRHAADHPLLHAWLFVVSLALLVTAVLARTYPMRVQDRVIRLEEHIRYLQLLSPSENTAAAALTLQQIVALRFASDAELPALLQRTLSENLPPKAIKESITQWRPDNLRV